MPKRAEEIAQAVTDHLNATPFTQPFEAVRDWEILRDLDETNRPVVTVVPFEVTPDPEQSANRIAARMYGVQVAVQRKLGAGDGRREIDETAELAETIWQELEPTLSSVAPAMSAAPWVSTEHENGTFLNEDDLRDRRLVTILATFTYADWR